VLAYAWLAWCHAELGTYTEGSALGEEGLRIAEQAAHPGSRMVASWGSGLLALRHGDLPRALPRLERAMGLCQETDIPFFFPQMAVALGAAYTTAGRSADAVSLLTHALQQATATARGALLCGGFCQALFIVSLICCGPFPSQISQTSPLRPVLGALECVRRLCLKRPAIRVGLWTPTT
jgi:hypothetical protein